MPIFLTVDEYRVLLHFLEEAPVMNKTQLLLLVGTIKSGKSLLLKAIEPLVAALREDAPAMRCRPPPVFFKFKFFRCQAAKAAIYLASAMRDFACLHGIALRDRDSEPLWHVASVAQELALGIHRTGRELWLLFDEAQGPILGSTVGDAETFMQIFKEVRTACVPTIDASASAASLPHSLAAHQELLVCWARRCHWEWCGRAAGRHPKSATKRFLTVGRCHPPASWP